MDMDGEKSNIKTQLFIWIGGKELGIGDWDAGDIVSEINAE